MGARHLHRWKPLEGPADSLRRWFRAASRRSWRAGIALLTLASVGLLGCPRAAEPPPEGTPRLVLFLVVDQMRADYVERMDPLFTGGLRRLLDEGVLFTQAHHDHAATNTAPGHAALATGRHPGPAGIVSNWWMDRTEKDWAYCVGDDRYDTSPAHLLVPGFGDWLQERYPTARVVSISGKDRSAVLMGGWNADGAFWYDKDTGGFTTSSYYDTPEWLEELNEEHVADKWFGQLWAPEDLDEETARQLDIVDLDEGPFGRRIPHFVGSATLGPSESFYGALYETPYLDELTGQYVRRLLETQDLGRDEVPDLLAVSFSSLDTVGHGYGPNSPEVVDVLLRLDRILEDLLRLVDDTVGLENVVISLSSDHGVAPLPELAHQRGRPGHRIDSVDIQCIQRAGRELIEELGVDPWIDGSRTLDPEVLEEEGLEADDVLRRAKALVSECPMVERAWLSSELEAPVSGELSEVERRYRNSYHPERSPDLAIQLRPLDVPLTGWQTGHGSVYDYDSHVPLLIRRPGGSIGRIHDPVRTVDLAPTLAELVGIPVPEGVDGVSLAHRLSAAEAPRVGSR